MIITFGYRKNFLTILKKTGLTDIFNFIKIERKNKINLKK